MTRKHPQSAYAGLQKSLQQDWAFLQRVIPGIGDAFGLVEEEIKTVFIPEIFYSVRDRAPGREITRLQVKQAGMALPDPKRTAPNNWQAYCVITGNLVSALRGHVIFQTSDHTTCLWDGRAGGKEEERGEGDGITGGDHCREPRGSHLSSATGGKDWGLADDAAVHGKWDGAGIAGMARSRLPALWPRAPRPTHILRRMQRQVLDILRPRLQEGGLVTVCHNELRDGVADLAVKAFTPSYVRNNPKVEYT